MLFSAHPLSKKETLGEGKIKIEVQRSAATVRLVTSMGWSSGCWVSHVPNARDNAEEENGDADVAGGSLASLDRIFLLHTPPIGYVCRVWLLALAACHCNCNQQDLYWVFNSRPGSALHPQLPSAAAWCYSSPFPSPPLCFPASLEEIKGSCNF